MLTFPPHFPWQAGVVALAGMLQEGGCPRLESLKLAGLEVRHRNGHSFWW